jgi:Na+-transporting NADH:ubiquinone oxidoreductase subunit NqrC
MLTMTIDMRHMVVVGIVVLSLISSVLVTSAQAGLRP